MKKMRRLVPAMAMLLVSAIMLSTASYAWFTMGTQATATGMTVKAEAASSLMIVSEADSTNIIEKFQKATNNVALTAVNRVLKPATKSDSSATKLATIEDPSSVVHATGAYTGDMVEVTANANSEYYIDYTVYIFAAGAAVTDKKLQVTVTPDAFTEVIHNAVTVDFWVATSQNATKELKGTINFETAKDTTKNTVNLGAMTIPVGMNDELTAVNDYVIVTMRVYYDGALKDATDNTKTYVRNDRIPTNNAGFGVQFDLVA